MTVNIKPNVLGGPELSDPEGSPASLESRVKKLETYVEHLIVIVIEYEQALREVRLNQELTIKKINEAVQVAKSVEHAILANKTKSFKD
jgi:hypothetical protein